MKRVLVVFMFLVGMSLSSVGIAHAQGTPEAGTSASDVDIEAIGETVLDVDPEDVVTALETPPDDAELPEGFINPPSGTPENAEVVEAFTGELAEIDGTVGNVSHAFDTDPDVVPGLLSAGVISYIVADEEITQDDLDDFEEGASSGFDGQTAGVEGTVERTEIAGSDAVLITVVTEQSGVAAVVQIVALPVGNVMVVGTVVVADQGEVNPDDIFPYAEELTLSGVSHLDTAAAGS